MGGGNRGGGNVAGRGRGFQRGGGMGTGRGGRGGAFDAAAQSPQQLQLKIQQLNQLLAQSLAREAAGAGAAGAGGGADMMEEDIDPTYMLQQQRRGNRDGGAPQVVPEVWLNEETGDVVATLQSTDIVVGASTQICCMQRAHSPFLHSNGTPVPKLCICTTDN